MDLALTLAEAGIPMSFYPMPILGATGPVTIAGSAVVNNAEFVERRHAVQLAHPGAPVIHGGGPTAMYMNSGAYAQQLARGHPAALGPGPHGRLLRRAGLVRRRRAPRPKSPASRAPTRTRSPCSWPTPTAPT